MSIQLLRQWRTLRLPAVVCYGQTRTHTKMTEKPPAPPPPFPRPGSAIAHALRMTRPAHRPALNCWLHWWHEVARIPLDVQDPGVAESKLRWWLSELQAAGQGQAGHPLMRNRLTQVVGPGASWPAWPLWLSQVEGLIQLVHQNRWMDEAHFVRHAQQTTGLACEGAATLLGAAGGGYVGHKIEQRTRTRTVYQVAVRMDNGSVRHFQRAQPTAVGTPVVLQGKGFRVDQGSSARGPDAYPQAQQPRAIRVSETY